jgi:8-oxo-dGTP diphosphatase
MLLKGTSSKNMPTDRAPPTIQIAAALLLGADGRMLLVRKRGTEAFMQPGGKIEKHEPPAVALVRELKEELGLTVDSAAPAYLGRFTAPAANEAGRLVEAEMFGVVVAQAVAPTAEIDAIVWIEPALPTGLTLAPLTRDHILPLHRSCHERARDGRDPFAVGVPQPEPQL